MITDGKLIFHQHHEHEDVFVSTPIHMGTNDPPFPGVTWHTAPDFRHYINEKETNGIIPFRPWGV